MRLEHAPCLARAQDPPGSQHQLGGRADGGRHSLGLLHSGHAFTVNRPCPENACQPAGKEEAPPAGPLRDGAVCSLVLAVVASPTAPHHPYCRVVDGATLAGFARTWAAYVESPGKLLLQLR